jgi:hypothetical protein
VVVERRVGEAGEQDERLAAELGDVDGCVCGERMVRGKCGGPARIRERHEAQAVQVGGAAEEGDVKAAVAQVAGLVAGWEVALDDADVRVPGGEAREYLGNQRWAGHRDEAEAEILDAPDDPCDRVTAPLGGVEGLARRCEERLSGLCWSCTAGVTRQQGGAELVLQRLDPARQCGLSDERPLGGAPEP